MNDKQKKFADRYLETVNGKDSAIYAGYSEATARFKASELLREPTIKAYIDEQRHIIETEMGVTRERLIKEIAALCYTNPKNYYLPENRLMDVAQMDDEHAAAVSSVKTYEDRSGGEVVGHVQELKFHDKLKALEMLGKILGVFEKDNNQKKSEIAIHINPDEEGLGE